MVNSFLIISGRLLSFLSRTLNAGNGSTWPGHIALSLNKNFIKDILKTNDQRLTIILVAGTNGKTTTGKLIQTILEKNGKKVFQNTAGANLLNGIASSLILNSNLSGKIDKNYAIFEIDENTLPLILREINSPNFIIILNLFRDQLDRYGEINTISKKWADALKELNQKTTLILNADDPQVAYLAFHLKGVNVKYFGINSNKSKTEKFQHASDSTYCPNCGEKLVYKTIYFSHLGDWTCKKCSYKHPEEIFSLSPLYPLSGVYNEYNTNASVLLAEQLEFKKENIRSALKDFEPAFGRQEVLSIDRKRVQIFLSKNPTSFNESLRTILEKRCKNLLIILNDRMPDGQDVSWIWDIDFESFIWKNKNITLSGDRVYDMGLRLKYASRTQSSPVPKGENVKSQNFDSKFKMYENMKEAIDNALKGTSLNETLYILPTYSAMLEVRKILTGREIL